MPRITHVRRALPVCRTSAGVPQQGLHAWDYNPRLAVQSLAGPGA